MNEQSPQLVRREFFNERPTTKFVGIKPVERDALGVTNRQPSGLGQQPRVYQSVPQCAPTTSATCDLPSHSTRDAPRFVFRLLAALLVPIDAFWKNPDAHSNQRFALFVN